MIQFGSIDPTIDMVILLTVCLWMIFRGRPRGRFP